MTYASIMVQLDREPACARRVALSLDLANRFEAMLIGIAARQARLTAFADPVVSDESALGMASAESESSIAGVEEIFRSLVAQHPGVRFRSDLADPGEFAADQSRSADLVIVGRQGSEDAIDGRFGADPGALVLSLGRPMLLVPPKIAHLRADHIVVAWKNSREARRAVSDSLPFLQRAQDVAVVNVDSTDGSAGTEDVVDLLCRHGVRAETQRVLFAARPPAEEIWVVAQARSADLIVAGAYGYNRLREWAFGGVTRDLLQHAPVCCLLSH